MLLDPRIQLYHEAAILMKEGRFSLDVPLDTDDEVGRLGQALLELGRSLEARFEQLRALNRLTGSINAGLVLDDVLDRMYVSFRDIIPYQRIGFSLLEDDGQTLRARWARSEAAEMRIGAGFSAPMAGSSLEDILESGEPRVINDLQAYLAAKPCSLSTRLIVEEGMLSSLTCPLIAMAKPVGFMFFSSTELGTYRNAHAELFKQIAGELATIVEKARLYQQLLDLNEVKDRFLGIAAHDLRNPIGVIQGYSQLMARGLLGEVTPEQERILGVFLKNCSRMLELIDSLLDVRAITAGKLEIYPVPLDPGSLVGECASAFEALASAKQIHVVADIENDLPLVLADANRLTQVLSNLFDNALKFSTPGTTVKLWSRREGDSVRIGVTDQGPGIPEDEIPRLFEEFFRASTRPTGGERSTGLGLAIVKRIVESLGSQIQVESKLGQGSTFSFALTAV